MCAASSVGSLQWNCCVVTSLVTAHALLNLNRAANDALAAAISLAGGVVAITGCALAVASGLVGRRYEPVER